MQTKDGEVSSSSARRRSQRRESEPEGPRRRSTTRRDSAMETPFSLPYRTASAIVCGCALTRARFGFAASIFSASELTKEAIASAFKVCGFSFLCGFACQPDQITLPIQFANLLTKEVGLAVCCGVVTVASFKACRITMAMTDGDPVTIDNTMRPKPASAAGDWGTPGTQIQQLLADNGGSLNIANSNLGPEGAKGRRLRAKAQMREFCFHCAVLLSQPA
jgi:hypothetical protein